MRVVVVPSSIVYRAVRHLSTARTALSVIQTRGVSNEKNSPASYQCVVIGGGTGGCAMASKMSRKLGRGKVAVIEPAQVSTSFFKPIKSESIIDWKIVRVLKKLKDF